MTGAQSAERDALRRLAHLPPDARATVIVVSDRSSAGTRTDTIGPLLESRLRAMGFEVRAKTIVPDEAGDITNELISAVDSGVDVVLTTGGTGLGPRDVTPEATRQVVDRLAPGFVEAIRAHRRAEVPQVSLSRAIAGVSDRTLIVNLPGVTEAVEDALGVLEPLLGFAVHQLRGGDAD